jgi:hypothetical protein
MLFSQPARAESLRDICNATSPRPPGLSNAAYLLRLSLFTYRDLTDWLDDPFGTPPLIPAPVQLALPGLGQPVPA